MGSEGIFSKLCLLVHLLYILNVVLPFVLIAHVVTSVERTMRVTVALAKTGDNMSMLKQLHPCPCPD